MSTASLTEVQRLVDRLTPLDQVRLLEYLTPRIARVVAAMQRTPAIKVSSPADAWQAFFQIGDALAEDDQPRQNSYTEDIEKKLTQRT